MKSKVRAAYRELQVNSPAMQKRKISERISEGMRKTASLALDFLRSWIIVSSNALIWVEYRSRIS